MGYKSKAFAGERVELSHGYWARVRPMNGDEAVALVEATALITNGTNNSQRAISRALTTAIVEWNLDDDENNILPINEQTINDLLAVDQMTLMTKVRLLNQPVGAADVPNLPSVPSISS